MAFRKVAITGGSGRLGKYVVDCMKDDFEVTVIDVTPPEQKDVQFVEASVLNLPDLENAFRGQDAVFHLAAIPNPRTAPPETTFHTNVQGTWNVMHAAENAGVRRVAVASSDAATGLHYNPVDGWAQYLPIDEAHPLRPVEFYSLSKEVTEAICRSYSNRGKLEVVAIRPTHIVFPPEWTELEARGADVQNYHLWAYVEPEDVAAAFRLTLAPVRLAYEAFFISAADSLCTKPTLDMVREREGKIPEVRRPDVYRDNPQASLLDITRAREVLGFEPKSNWRDLAAKAARS